jgi:hypothetical protein
MSDKYLQLLVTNRCRELGDEKAAEFFAVSETLVRQWVNGSKTPSLAAVEKVFVLPEGASVDAAWEGKEVFIAAPFYKSTNPRTMFSVLAVWDRPKYGYRHRFGDAFIVHARNTLADDYLKSGLPVCQWVDDDLIFPCGQSGWYLQNSGIPMPESFAARHGPNRLRSHGKSLVGGLYYGRFEHGKAMYAEATLDPKEDARSRTYVDELKATDWVGTGFLQHNRQVLLDIQATHPHLAPQHASESFHFFSNTSDEIVGKFGEMQAKADLAAKQIRENSVQEASRTIADLIHQMQSAYADYLKFNRLQQGEDQLFCSRARKAGHQPYVDLGLVCGHVDGSTVFGPHNTGKA